MLTKKTFNLNENTSFVADILENVILSFEYQDIDDPETQDVIEKLFQAVEKENINIATAAFTMKDQMTLGACLNLVIYCVRAWFAEGGQYTFYYMSSIWMKKHIEKLTDGMGNKFNLLISILTALARMSKDKEDKIIMLDLQHNACKYALILEGEEKWELAVKFYLLAVQVVEYSDYHEIALLHERLDELAAVLEDERLDSVVSLLNRLKAIAQPGNHDADISGVINDLKDDFIIHKEVFSHQVDQAILFAIYHQLGRRKEYQHHYQDFKEALAF